MVKTISEAVQEESNIELLPERGNESVGETCESNSWYASFWFWAFLILIVAGGIYFWFFK